MKTCRSLIASRILSRLAAATTAIALLLGVVDARAIPITFTHTGTGSGTIGTTAFNDAGFVITGLADTDDRRSYSDGFFAGHDSTSIIIADVGTYQFTTATRTFVNNVGFFPGFSRQGSSGDDLGVTAMPP